uniref:CCHC-type domain-containing protein n=1 Tax=Globodera rostochiensis TaxID=31243 RepID=A0A914GXH6_GLORO
MPESEAPTRYPTTGETRKRRAEDSNDGPSARRDENWRYNQLEWRHYHGAVFVCGGRRGGRAAQNDFRCYNCGGHGHMARNCGGTWQEEKGSE